MMRHWPASEIKKALEELDSCTDSSLSVYADDPVAFGRAVLGEDYTEDVIRMMESVRDHEVTVAISANATGKTHAAARVAAWWATTRRHSQVYTAAAPPLDNLEMLLWGEIGSITRSHPEIFKDFKITSLHIERGPQEFLTGVTIPASGTDADREARFSGKHAEHLLFVIDEGDAVPAPVYKGIESCISGGNARLLIMFNPRARSGEVYRMIREKRANVVHLSAFNHPNVRTGQDVIPGAVTQAKTVKRINEWCRPLVPGERAGLDTFKLPDFLVGTRAERSRGVSYPPLSAGRYKIMQPAFSHMVLGQYPAQGETQLISEEWINLARSRWDAYVAVHGEVPPAGVKGIGGMDVADYGDDECSISFRYGGFLTQPVRWSGVDVLVSADRAVEEARTRPRVSCINVDATGLGAGVAPAIVRQGVTAYRIMVAERPTYKTDLGEFAQLRDQLWWSYREWLRVDPGAMLPPDDLLIEESIVMTYSEVNGRIKVLRKDEVKPLLGRSPDTAEAVIMTFAPRVSAFNPGAVDRCAA